MIANPLLVPAAVIVVAALLSARSLEAATSGSIRQDADGKSVEMTDGTGQLALRLSYDGRCVLNRVTVRGRQVVAKTGVFSGFRQGEDWFTTKQGIATPKVSIGTDAVTVSGIVFGRPGFLVRETWQFTVRAAGITWRIDREYPGQATLEDAAMPEWNFARMSTWKGGILGNGGVVWNKYLERINTTYGVHTGAVTFWNVEAGDALCIVPSVVKDAFEAVRFSHQPGDVFSFDYLESDRELKPRHELHRWLADRQDLWAPFEVKAGKVSVEFSLEALDYDATYDRGTFKGIDGESIRELLNTVGRYGVIDTKLVGANGWRSGYICLHEQWFAQIGLALDDPNYLANLAAALDYERDHAIEKSGRVKSRWTYDAGDAMPGSFGSEGFYEAQWGYLMDSQPDYVTNVAELFDLTADREWLAGQKVACERALKFLMDREVGNSGLVAMMTDSTRENHGSDWIDIIWASYENALVNAKLYYALSRWSDAEDALGDPASARFYRDFAARLKTSFNRPIADGGFWNPKKKWYVYWRDKDGSVHGDNLVTPVNFSAISYGICDDPERKKAILDRIESEMRKEDLFHWPLSFFPYANEEGAGSNFPFPRYENGAIFLSWGEVGVRAYASYDPAIAVKYVQNVLARYERDGLSFQRYERNSQEGAGDDILAGNCLTIVGLFRDIYGIQPKPDRLYFEPHLTDELNGTRIRYSLRGHEYLIDPSTSDCTVTAGNSKIRSVTPFGVSAIADGMEYFPRHAAEWELAITRTDGKSVSVQIQSWPDGPNTIRRWTESSSAPGSEIRRVVRRLKPRAFYEVIIDEKKSLSLQADEVGLVKFTTSGSSHERRFEIHPATSFRDVPWDKDRVPSNDAVSAERREIAPYRWRWLDDIGFIWNLDDAIMKLLGL